MVTKMKKLQIAYPIIVEGKYDKMKLLAICEGLIIKTDGIKCCQFFVFVIKL